MERIYNLNGDALLTGLDSFMQGCNVGYYYNESSDTFYIMTRVFKKRPDGTELEIIFSTV